MFGHVRWLARLESGARAHAGTPDSSRGVGGFDAHRDAASIQATRLRRYDVQGGFKDYMLGACPE